MAIAQERDGNFLVLRLSGSFAEGDVEFEAALTQAVSQSEAEIIVDLSGIDDFRALRTLTAAERLRRDQGAMHRLALVVTPGSAAADRFMMGGMSKIIPIFPTIGDVRLAWETDGFPA
jgi:hypothetical protein